MSRAHIRLAVLGDQLSVSSRSDSVKNVEQVISRASVTNWSNIDACYPTEHHHPLNETEFVTIMQRLNMLEEPVKARFIGSGFSPLGDVFYTNGHMIHLNTYMHKVLHVNREKKQITVQGGCTLETLYSALDEAGFMIRCVPAVLGPTVGGALAVGVHGSGRYVSPLSGFVTSIRAVTASGELLAFTRQRDPVNFAHWMCHMGVLGAVTEITLQAEPKEEQYRVTRPITVKEVRASLNEKIKMNSYYRFHWIPHTEYCIETIVNSSRAADDDRLLHVPDTKVQRGSTQSDDALDFVTSEPQVLRSALSERTDDIGNLLHLLPKELTDLNLTDTVRTHVLEAALLAATYSPHLIPAINVSYQRLALNDEEEAQGSCAEMMSMNCYFKQYTSEYAIDVRHAAEVFDAIINLVKEKKLYVHFPVEFRFGEADDATMSPARGRATCYVGVVMYKPHGRETPGTMRYLTLFAQLMSKYDGRPHWGKFNNDMKSTDIAKLYGKSEWESFNEYRKKCDPKGILVNQWYAKLLR